MAKIILLLAIFYSLMASATERKSPLVTDVDVYQSIELGAPTAAALNENYVNENQEDLKGFKQSLYSLYNRELRHNSNLDVQMSIAFIVQPSGVVSYAKVESTTYANEKFNKAILQRLMQVHFSRPPNKAIMATMPLNFLPG